MSRQKSESYNAGNCCGDDCYFIWAEDEPCWGDVEVVNEEVYYDDDGEIFDSSWIHACKGHEDKGMDLISPYIEEPK